MKFLIALLAICMSIALVAGQFRQFNFNALDFGAPNTVRDPRQNRGPVVFPPSPPDAIDESSGVIVGASGYGFVPPQQRQTYYSTSLETPSAAYSSFNYYSPYTNRYSFF